MNQLNDKVVFLTGASSGIGAAVQQLLLAQGAKVFSMSRRQVISEWLNHQTFAGDVSSEQDVEEAFRRCKEAFGGVDVLINNAGSGLPTPDLADTTVETFEQMVGTNMRGVFLCSRAAVRMMKPIGKGHILNLISMAGQRTNPNAPLYCASKFGARGLSSGFADQVLKLGIKVTDVNPGPVDSDYWGDRKVPREKFLKIGDVAKIILFVLSQPEDLVIREINFDNMKFLAG
ncbi:SDR family oxidoreductase [Parapedobacter indicus]|uniref:NADP-dependent 3-hydroxy acid dehydrogenase YdfG n=1 Tax=Parapedobacter indicus TaxID=1477437 RepID=A0A1I3HII0_9SPHI|nr:SDR family oxidoreductase [Parapedobacter indicus]PPL03050.1 NADP-dependent 3-hydroxy acid dehydrogenase YdfG [Parapedobacter indicus]SFI35429.1 NADP-dependent 3-hydroxy acid dehydrogenase YdfG [Parapedobacter indicus]